MPPQMHSQHQPPYPQIRHHTPSASPPIGTNGGHFQGHPGYPIQRGHTPQPPIGSRPTSRNDMHRMGPGMVPQTGPPPGPAPGPPHPGISYMPTPPIYNPNAMMPPQGQYPYAQQPQPGQAPPPPPPPPTQQHQPPYLEERRTPQPPAFTSQPPAPGLQAPVRHEPSPQPNHQQLPSNPMPPHISPPPQPPHQPERRLQDPPPPPPVEPKTEPQERPQPSLPLLNTDTAIKKLPQRKSHSIFTPIEENRSILSQHLASFASEPIKSELGTNVTTASHRSQSVDVAAINRAGSNTSSPPLPQPPQRPGHVGTDKSRTVSLSSIPETTLTPPSRSNSLKVGGARPRGPRLTVQIPAGASENGDSPAADSNSPQVAEPTTQPPQRHNSQSSLVLPPPSPSASALLSAGATGPPNPFARPPPQTTVNGESTPVSALPSRFLNNELLPSPSSFYPEWNFRGEGNTLPSPLNFATPVVGSGPSFLREENQSSNLNVVSNHTATKRKTPEYGATAQSEAAEAESESKRVKVE